MGMFDTLKCNFPLPNKEAQDKEFQTKELRCEMDQLEITSGGRLVRIKSGYDDEECVLDLNYHDDIYFYTDIGKDWYEYRAKFNNGQLQTIERVKR